MGKAMILDHKKVETGAAPPASDIVAWLSRSETYGEGAAPVERAETHISWVFLTPRYAYKLKKPVRFEFLDFTTPALRKAACEAEVRLNRRLAPHVYLGVLPITCTPQGRLRLGGPGVPVEWLVRMRRLPADRSLDALIRSGRLTAMQVDRLASKLADFYQSLPPLTLRVDDYRRHIEQHVRANRAELLAQQHGLEPTLIKRTHASQLRVLKLAPDVLENRAGDGRVVEGHGDLRPEHVYFTPEPTIIDCIEFSEEFRQLDVLDELSFLAMECDYLGAGQLGEQIIARYCRVNGDRPPRCLLPFYKSYRATVHAKVATLRSDQHAARQRRRDLRIADKYLRLADAYAAELGPPLLLIVRGLTGSGKSTVARQLSLELGTEWLQTDAIRREVFLPEGRRAGREGTVYRKENRQRVYAEMLLRGEALLEASLSVTLDATFLEASLLRRAAALGRRHGAAGLILDCHCPEAVARDRIAGRLYAGDSLSEATADVYWQQKQEWEPVPADLPTLHLDTTASLPCLVDEVLRTLRHLDAYRSVLDGLPDAKEHQLKC
jgi:aminoglycoside phosphotransferase family enzyme/predicted kinase